jgi:hypothetical protein
MALMQSITALRVGAERLRDRGIDLRLGRAGEWVQRALVVD